MIKIMFVCHGNICRSPMAEFILRDMVAKQNRDKEFLINSSATSTEEIYAGIGNPIYPPARKELAKHGIFPEDKRAVQLKRSDLEKYDYFICMDERNKRNAALILGNTDKIYKIMDFTEKGGDVADPWYSGDFVAAYDDIFEGCQGLLKKIG